MNLSREEIKKQMEDDNSSPISQGDVEAVSKLISVLEKEDRGPMLSSNFSESIIQRVIQKQAKQNRFGWFGFFAGIFGLISALFISLALVEFKLDLGFLKGIANYSGLFLFGIAFIILLNILEKKIIRFSSE